QALATHARFGEPLFECRTRAEPERRMLGLVVHLVGPVSEALVQLRQGPNGQRPRAYGLRNLADISRELGVAGQVVEELGVRRSEQPLDDRPESRLGGRSRLLGAAIHG